MRKRFKLSKPSHSTVVAYLALFLVLSGAAAYAAGQLGKNTVGTKQLKKNAVTKAKLKKGSVNSSKIVDGSITGADIDAASTPFGQIVHEARGNSTVPVGTGPNATVYPLENSTYTQPAGRDDLYVGVLDVTIPSTCEGPREVSADILVDPANPLKPSTEDLVAVGGASDEGSGQRSVRINIGPFLGGRFLTTAPANHTVVIVVGSQCKSGGGVTATFGGVDVLGTS